MGDSFNDWGSSEETTLEAHKSSIDSEAPSETLDEQPLRRSWRIRCPPDRYGNGVPH